MEKQKGKIKSDHISGYNELKDLQKDLLDLYICSQCDCILPLDDEKYLECSKCIRK